MDLLHGRLKFRLNLLFLQASVILSDNILSSAVTLVDDRYMFSQRSLHTKSDVHPKREQVTIRGEMMECKEY